jgi:hypothetical protein
MPASHSTRELLIDLTEHPHKCFQQTWKTERKVQIEQCSEKETFHKIWIPMLAHCIFSKIQHSSLPRISPLPDRTHKLKTAQCMQIDTQQNPIQQQMVSLSCSEVTLQATSPPSSLKSQTFTRVPLFYHHADNLKAL